MVQLRNNNIDPKPKIKRKPKLNFTVGIKKPNGDPYGLTFFATDDKGFILTESTGFDTVQELLAHYRAKGMIIEKSHTAIYQPNGMYTMSGLRNQHLINEHRLFITN